ncbi:MAG TPA: acetolactate synthase [Cyanobacteria bacterium UBA9971]|nr:acetolactate synthase [Cyanobacteria bacterium UBA9971]
MRASDYIINYLADNKINKIYGYIGGAIAYLADSLYKHPQVEMVNMIHEQGAAFAAEGFARTTGITGVAIATSGPGATNLITSIGSCFFDSIPALFITGQVNTYDYKYNNPRRQVGFQETDIVSIIKPITKYAVMISNTENLRYELEKCLYLSAHGRKGPVLLDIPMNIQRDDIDFDKSKSFFDSEEFQVLSCKNNISKEILADIELIINTSKRPVLLLGGGIRLAFANDELKVFIEKTKIPIVHSLMGTDAVAGNYKYNMGLIGAYGNRYGNFTLANADLIIVLGSRLDTRQTGTNLNLFAREAKIIHVDIDENELNCKNIANIKLKTDIKEFLKEINLINFKLNLDFWHKKILEYKDKYPSVQNINGVIKNPNLLIAQIFNCLKSDDVVCVDVGQHQMWTAQSCCVQTNQRIHFSGGMGSMGFALPCAIGSTIATGKRSIVITGDGGLQMNIQELEILKRRNLPVKIIVMNNQNLGMVRQFQEIYFESRLQSTVIDYSVPDFEKIAKAYGLSAKSIFYYENINDILKEFLEDPLPGLLNIYTEKFTVVEPKLIINYPIEDMHPFLDRKEFESRMIIKSAVESKNVQFL